MITYDFTTHDLNAGEITQSIRAIQYNKVSRSVASDVPLMKTKSV